MRASVYNERERDGETIGRLGSNARFRSFVVGDNSTRARASLVVVAYPCALSYTLYVHNSKPLLTMRLALSLSVKGLRYCCCLCIFDDDQEMLLACLLAAIRS